AAGEFDAVDEIAMPVPVDVIAELLGVPRSDRRRFHDWSDRIVVGFSLAPGNYMRASATVLPAIFRLQGYLNRILASRRQQATDRTATEPYRVGDSTVPAGGRIMLALGASNRDPAKYPDPETFVVDRNPSDHLAFGSGIHFCLGAHLARLEVATVLRRLLQSG